MTVAQSSYYFSGKKKRKTLDRLILLRSFMMYKT